MLDTYFTIRMSRQQVEAIDAYRRRQPGLESRAETIRKLLWLAILTTRTDKLPEDDEHEHGTDC